MEKLRHGFTTGSCAAAAAKAAAIMLFGGGEKNSISILTPKGIVFNAEIVNIEKTWDTVKCGVVKDGGDDPDVTTGLTIFAEVRRSEDEGVTIKGGPGVGLVTKPGLDQKVGNHAINSVPREMIEKEVGEVLKTFDPGCGVEVTISCPGGEETAKKTFNPRLGIEGGISILGTSGIVEPMSEDALVETIRVELSQRKAEGFDTISISPGNYGLDFMQQEYGFNLDRSVKCSNYIGLTLDALREFEFKKILFVGHAGKLVKIAGGIMNTHSKEADSRMEIIAAAAIEEGADISLVKKILASNTTDEAFTILKEEGLKDGLKEDLMGKVSKRIVDKILFYMDKRARGELEMECVMFTKELGLLAKSSGADKLVEEIKRMEDGYDI